MRATDEDFDVFASWRKRISEMAAAKGLVQWPSPLRPEIDRAQRERGNTDVWWLYEYSPGGPRRYRATRVATLTATPDARTWDDDTDYRKRWTTDELSAGPALYVSKIMKNPFLSPGHRALLPSIGARLLGVVCGESRGSLVRLDTIDNPDLHNFYLDRGFRLVRTVDATSGYCFDRPTAFWKHKVSPFQTYWSIPPNEMADPMAAFAHAGLTLPPLPTHGPLPLVTRPSREAHKAHVNAVGAALAMFVLTDGQKLSEHPAYRHRLTVRDAKGVVADTREQHLDVLHSWFDGSDGDALREELRRPQQEGAFRFVTTALISEVNPLPSDEDDHQFVTMQRTEGLTDVERRAGVDLATLMRFNSVNDIDLNVDRALSRVRSLSAGVAG